jgi:hypothetical protein
MLFATVGCKTTPQIEKENDIDKHADPRSGARPFAHPKERDAPHHRLSARSGEFD